MLELILKLPMYYNNMVILTHALGIIGRYFLYSVAPLIRSYRRTVKRTLFISMLDIII